MGVIASDSIEHIPDPDPYMRFLKSFCAKYAILSSPDRDILGLVKEGPPNNTAHVREWTHDELAAYVSKFGFRVLDVRRNPQSAQWTMWFLLEVPEQESRCKEGTMIDRKLYI